MPSTTTDQPAADRLLPHDVTFYEREIAPFLPDRVFDAHLLEQRRPAVRRGLTGRPTPPTRGSRPGT